MVKKHHNFFIIMLAFIYFICGFEVFADDIPIGELSDYQEVVKRINLSYDGVNFEITDTETFIENIVSKISVQEFEDNLIQDAEDFQIMETLHNTIVDSETEILSYPSMRASAYVVRKSATLSNGNKSAKFWCDFELVDLSNYKYFNTRYGHGITPIGSWTFNARKTCVLKFTTQNCTIQFSGAWMNTTTGLLQTTTHTYAVVYYP